MPRRRTISKAARENSSKPLVISVSFVPSTRLVKNTASPADQIALQGAAAEASALHEAAAEDAVIALLHGLEELRNVLRLMAEAGIDFENPVHVRAQRFAIAADVGIHHAPVFRRPDDSQPRFLPAPFPARAADELSVVTLSRTAKKTTSRNPTHFSRTARTNPVLAVALIRHRAHDSQFDVR